VLFLELGNFLWILRNYRDPPEFTFEVDGVTVTRTTHHEFDFHRWLMSHHDRFEWVDAVGNTQTVHKTHPMAIVSFAEISLFLDDLGFEEVHTFNSLVDRTPGPLSGSRILVSARKGSTDSGFLTGK
jgi:hypothetical protein